jgi:hypothetical protein
MSESGKSVKVMFRVTREDYFKLIARADEEERGISEIVRGALGFDVKMPEERGKWARRPSNAPPEKKIAPNQ